MIFVSKEKAELVRAMAGPRGRTMKPLNKALISGSMVFIPDSEAPDHKWSASRGTLRRYGMRLCAVRVEEEGGYYLWAEKK